MTQAQELHVVFGSGPLGLSVVHELVKRGKQVRVVNRSGKASVPQGVQVVSADAYNHDAAREASSGASHIYQCAQPHYHEWVEKFPPLQASILEAAAANRAVLVVGENLYMYSADVELISESSPQRPSTRKGTVRKAMADALLDAHRAGKVRAVIGRAADFYGPHVAGSSLGDRFFKPLVAGKPAEVLGNVDVPHSYTFIGDFGTALVNLGERVDAHGQAWHVPNAPAITHREIVKLAADAAGVEPKFRAASKLFIRLGGLFVPEAREMVEMFYEFEKPYIVDDRKYKAVFGDHSTSLRDGLRQAVDWYRGQA